MGVIMGTAAYMAPEQAKGKVADKRADVWAFGVVLFEMLTGRRTFEGDDISEVMAGVIKSEPEWDALPTELSPAVVTYLRRCLQKDPRERIRDIGDVRLAIAGAFDLPAPPPVDVPEPAATVPPLRLWQRPVAATAIVLLLATITGLAVWILTPPPVPPAPCPLAQFVLQTPPDGPVRARGGATEVAISPDGTRVVYASGQGRPQDWRLYVRQLGELDATPLRGTEGGFAPFFSPDGQSVGFRVAPGGVLKQVSVLGGPAVTIVVPDSPRGVTWGPDDTIVFGSPSGLMRVPAVGGDPEPLTTVDPEQGETEHHSPDVLPNGKGVLFTAWSGTDEGSRVAVVSLETGAVSYLLTGGSHPRYAPTGHIVYGVGGTLRAVGFDADRLERTTDPVPVVENVNTKPSGAANFALAANGSLVYVSGAGAGGGAQRSLVRVDREGREEPLATPLLPYEAASISPNGTQVAYSSSWRWRFGYQTADQKLTNSAAPAGTALGSRDRPENTGWTGGHWTSAAPVLKKSKICADGTAGRSRRLPSQSLGPPCLLGTRRFP